MTEITPLILTALLDKHAFARFDALRQEYFPPERNYLRAHLTMFHHLPGTQAAEIVNEVKDAARHEEPMPARADRMMFMGRGSSILIECDPLRDFRARLGNIWQHQLIPQDKQGWRPHVTVQNKVEPPQARRLHRHLSARFKPCTIHVCGLRFFRYDYGPWTLIAEVPFTKTTPA